MGDIYTGIDLGTDSIKVVVTEKVNDKLLSCILLLFSLKSGILSINFTIVWFSNSVKQAMKKINDQLGIKITKVVAAIPPTNARMDIVLGTTNIFEYNEITGIDISNVLLDALKGIDNGS